MIPCGLPLIPEFCAGRGPRLAFTTAGGFCGCIQRLQSTVNGQRLSLTSALNPNSHLATLRCGSMAEMMRHLEESDPNREVMKGGIPSCLTYAPGS
jgi:hypothetical protein